MKEKSDLIQGLSALLKKQVYGQVLFIWLQSLTLIGIAYCLATLIDKWVVQGVAETALYPNLISLAGLFLLRLLWRGGRDYLGLRGGLILKQSLSTDLFNRGIRPELGVFTTYTPYAWSTLLIEEVEAVTGYFMFYLPQRIALAPVMLTVLIVVAGYNWLVAGLLLLIAPLLIIFMILIGWKTKEAQARRFEQLTRLGHQFLDRVKGLAVLKAFNQVDSQAKQLVEGGQSFRQQTLDILKIAFLSSAVLEFFSALGIALVAVYLGLGLLNHQGWGYVGGVGCLKTALFILMVIPEYFNPLRQFAQAYHSKQVAEVVMTKIESYQVNYPSPSSVWVQAKNTLITLPFTQVKLSHINYTYPRGIEPALVFNELEIVAGERVAIVGASGSGKTTLLHLLLGALQPQAGQRLWNDQSGFDFQSTLSAIGWAGQEAVWIKGTVDDNLKPIAHRSNIPLSEALAWVGLPQNSAWLEQEIGEAGEGLSGGQLQRLALARVYLKQAPLWVLDEPTAHLDQGQTEYLNLQLGTLSPETTLIFTTHKKESARLATRLIILDEGRIVGDGPWESLCHHPVLRGW